MSETILITILIAFISAFIILYVNRLNYYRSAANKFRDKIFTIFKGLYPNPVDWPENRAFIVNILIDKFPELDSAVAEFRPFIPFYKRWLFDRAWFRYRCSTGRKIDTQCYHHYIEFGSNPGYKDNFHRNVSKLLSFAKVK